jgi:hypothetical protein
MAGQHLFKFILISLKETRVNQDILVAAPCAGNNATKLNGVDYKEEFILPRVQKWAELNDFNVEFRNDLSIFLSPTKFYVYQQLNCD